MPIFKPFTSLRRDLVKSGTGISADVESRGSLPLIIFIKIAVSVTSFVIGPIWSREEANATNPRREPLPYVGFTPTTPHMAGSHALYWWHLPLPLTKLVL